MGQIDPARVADVALQGLLVYARLKLDRSLALVARLPTADAESGGYGIEQPAAGTHRRRIMIDVAMPGLNGIETVKRARQRWPFLRVLYVTGYVDMAGAERRRPAYKEAVQTDRSHKRRPPGYKPRAQRCGCKCSIVRKSAVIAGCSCCPSPTQRTLLQTADITRRLISADTDQPLRYEL